MPIQELIDFSQNFKITDETKERIISELKKLDEEFCHQAEAMRPTPEFMNRIYTL